MVINKQICEENRTMKKRIAYDYEKHMVRNCDTWFYTNGKKKTPLLSVSTWLNPINKMRLAKIPSHILDQAKEEGSSVMNWLKYIWDNRIQAIGDLNYESKKIEEMVYAVIQCLIDNNLEIRAIEKHITNGFWHGYIDMVCWDRKNQIFNIIEIKTRTGFEVKDTDKIQVMTYKRLMNSLSPAKVMIVDKATRQAKLFDVDIQKDFELITNVMNRALKALEMDDYIIHFHNKNVPSELQQEIQEIQLLNAIQKRNM